MSVCHPQECCTEAIKNIVSITTVVLTHLETIGNDEVTGIGTNGKHHTGRWWIIWIEDIRIHTIAHAVISQHVVK